jgi:hypothetical protein
MGCKDVVGPPTFPGSRSIYLSNAHETMFLDIAFLFRCGRKNPAPVSIHSLLASIASFSLLTIKRPVKPKASVLCEQAPLSIVFYSPSDVCRSGFHPSGPGVR